MFMCVELTVVEGISEIVISRMGSKHLEGLENLLVTGVTFVKNGILKDSGTHQGLCV